MDADSDEQDVRGWFPCSTGYGHVLPRVHIIVDDRRLVKMYIPDTKQDHSDDYVSYYWRSWLRARQSGSAEARLDVGHDDQDTV